MSSPPEKLSSASLSQESTSNMTSASQDESTEINKTLTMTESMEKVIIHVGTRESKLAMIQTKHVIKCLEDLHNSNRTDGSPFYEFRIESMKTIGDKILDQPLPEIGDKGLFTQELEEALLDQRVDFIVHSLKDLPTSLPEKCCIGAILS